MKTTIVPAQVTTVEDKIAGNLGFTQLLLLVTPVFLSGALFGFFPPFLKVAPYKLVLGGLLALVCITLAIRIKGKILLSWISIISRYNVRPRFYLFDKNDSYLRTSPSDQQALESEPVIEVREAYDLLPELMPMSERVRLETAVLDPRADFHFKTTKKGALRVYIREIKEEAV